MRKELISGLIVLMMIVTAAPMAVDGDDYPQDNYALTAESTETSDKGYPSHLDLREKGLVTHVKNQKPWGTCWAHGAISSIETNLIKKGYADLSIDLSELHLAYYMTHQSEDPLGGYSGDTITTKNYLKSGSNDNYTSVILGAWRGVALEEDVPYTWASESLVLDPSTEYGLTKYIVTDVSLINPYDRGAIKKALNGGDSVTVGYCTTDSGYNIVKDGDVRTSYYCILNEDAITNHEVTIIGYDDSIPKESFSNVPKGDGAWLIKNSWGTEDSRMGSDGCFWLSYYSTGMEVCALYSAIPADGYAMNYGYDGGGSMHQNIICGTSGTMANVFTAVSDQTVDAVSFFTMENGTRYIAKVYRNLSDPGNPESGKLVCFTSGTCKHLGYHTVDVAPAYMCKGDTFSVVVELYNDNGVELAVDTSVDAIDPYFEGVWGEVRTTAKAGQSFVNSGDGKWTDIGTDGMSNVRVKALANVYEPRDTSNTAMLCIAAGLIILTIAAIAVEFRKN